MVRVLPMLGGRVATMLAQFLSLALIGRTLGPSEFGALQIALVTFVYLTFLSDLGISVLGTRDNVRLKSRGWVGIYVGARLGLGVVTIAIVGIGSALLGLNARDAGIVAVLGVGLISSSLSLRWLVQAREQFAHLALIDTIAATVQLASAAALAMQHGGVVWAAATMASAPLVSAFMTAIVMRKSLEMPRLGAATIHLVRVALPAGVAVFATALYFYIDTILLGIVRSPAEVGYYGAAYRFVFAALALPTVANAVALPVLSRLIPGSHEELQATLSSTSTILLYIALPVAAATSIMAPGLVELVFGSEFAPASGPLAVLIWTCVTVSANTPFAALMLARRQDRRYMFACLLGGVANLGMNVFAIPVWGVAGAAVASIATEVIVLALILISTADCSPRILLRATRSAILPTMIMSLAMWPLRDSAIAVVVGVASWAVAGWITGSLRPTRVRSVIRSIRPG
jgi:O-antigen/teichoic acid export membrane protein